MLLFLPLMSGTLSLLLLLLLLQLFPPLLSPLLSPLLLPSTSSLLAVVMLLLLSSLFLFLLFLLFLLLSSSLLLGVVGAPLVVVVVGLALDAVTIALFLLVSSPPVAFFTVFLVFVVKGADSVRCRCRLRPANPLSASSTLRHTKVAP